MNVKNEYGLLCKIIDTHFLVENQDLMEEKLARNLQPHRVCIDCGSGETIDKTLYRFDLKKINFLPFFNETNVAPEGLRQFCDYILLVERMRTTHIILIEMKSTTGHRAEAKKQLNASETFMRYIVSSAKRLKIDFESGDNKDFKTKNIKWAKVILEKHSSNKKTLHEYEDKYSELGYIIYQRASSILISDILKDIKRMRR